MTSGTNTEVRLEAQGALPNFRYDLMQPLIQGRVAIEDVTLTHTSWNDSAGYFDNPRFKGGDFGLLDVNVGDVLPAIEAGWDMVCLPVFNKRKPVYNFLWVRADRAIESPKDLEGKTLTTVGYASSISTYSRGLLHRFYGVDLTRLRWLSAAPGRFPLYKDVESQIEYAQGPRKSTVAASARRRSRRKHRRHHRRAVLAGAGVQPAGQTPVPGLPRANQAALARAPGLYADAHHGHGRQAQPRASRTRAQAL